MPQASNIYACARISALQKKIIDRSTMLRLSESSPDEIRHVLSDMHYGGSADLSEFDIDELTERVRTETAKELKTLSTIPEITDLFLLETDVRNLKVLIKASLLGDESVELQDGGIYSPQKLRQLFSERSWTSFPDTIRETVVRLVNVTKQDTDPQSISVELDKAYYRHALDTTESTACAFAKKYFRACCDFGNIIMMFRIKSFDGSAEAFESAMLPSGDVRKSTLIAAFDSPVDSIAGLFSGSAVSDSVKASIAAYQATGSIFVFEKARDNYLLDLVKTHKHDVFTVYPVLGYYFARDREAKALRLISTVKRNNLDNSIISERLCELYG